MRHSDTWPIQIPLEKLSAYKQMIADGLIRNPHVVYNKRYGSTVVEYEATEPHEWILEELKRRCSYGFG